MSLYRIAELVVNMDCTGETLIKQGEAYKLSENIPANIFIEPDRKGWSELLSRNPHMTSNDLEYIQTGYHFSQYLIHYDGFCLHSSALAYNNKAILFSGPSGTGKSTHTGLWQEYFGKYKVSIINDDKPAIRLIDDTFYVHGTPWSGKTDLNLNIKVPLQAIVFLKQAAENRIRRLNNAEAVKLLIYQSIKPSSSVERMDRFLVLLDKLLHKIPVYQLECTISTEAVKLVFNETNL